MQVIRSQERGFADHGWLKSYHSFSFANYYNPNMMGFRALRVINDDKIAGGMGFGTHPHNDMEIVTYVMQGELQHKDSMGNGSIIRPGEVQRMSAGTGIQHSEFNASRTDEAHLLQIWILPDRRGHTPSYEQTKFPEAERQGKLRLVVSNNGREGSVTVHQDVSVYASLLSEGETLQYTLPAGRHAWLQVARGALTVNGVALTAGDAVTLSAPGTLDIQGGKGGEFLLFDLA